MRRDGRHTLPFLLLCAGLGQCTGGPGIERVLEVAPGQRVAVSYQVRDQLTLAVVNRSGVTAQGSQQARRDNPNLKVIPDAEVQQLLDRFGAHGFFAVAQPFPDPLAKAWLVVEHEGTRYVVSGRVPEGGDLGPFLNSTTSFNDTYNANTDFSGSEMSASELERSSQDVNQSSEAVRAKKEGKSQGQ